MVFSGYSGFLHQNNSPPLYNWYIVEIPYGIDILTWLICTILPGYAPFQRTRRGRRGRDRMVVGFITTYAISAYHHQVCQWLATGWWFSSVVSVSPTNKTDITEKKRLKVELNIIITQWTQSSLSSLWQFSLGKFPVFFLVFALSRSLISLYSF